MNSKVKVSVIIPVYNTEKYLRQCLDSVLNQTLQEIEVICVDDGSTDSSLSILHEYEKTDARVRVLTQPNSNAGAARNNGMSIAQGEYLVFLDSDDFFELDMLELACNRIKEENADICIWAADQYDDQKKQTVIDYCCLKENLIPFEPFNAANAGNNIFRISNGAPWTKMYSAEFVFSNSLKFQEIKNSNDLYFTETAMALAKGIVSVRSVLTHYRIGVSAGLTAVTWKDPMCFCEALLALKKKLENEEIYETLKIAFVNKVIASFSYNLKKHKTSPQMTRYVCNEFKTRYISQLDLLPIRYEYIFEDYQEKYYSMMKRMYGSFSRIPEIKQMASKQLVTNPSVSVIIPVYNVENYLRQCLNSVINQTLQSIEVICVDDGSTDSSLAILEEYAKKDGRITVISELNGGLSCARNRGLSYARGEYVYFLDSDDYLVPIALEALAKAANEDNADVIIFNAETVYETEALKESHASFADAYQKEKPYDEVLSGTEMLSKLLKMKAYRSSVPLQFFRREFLDGTGVCFLEGVTHEDELFTPIILNKASRVLCLNQPFYFRRIRENSIMSAAKSSQDVIDYYIIASHLDEEQQKLENNYERQAAANLRKRMVRCYDLSQKNYEKQGSAGRKKVKEKIPAEYSYMFHKFCESVDIKSKRTYRIARKINRIQNKFSVFKHF